MGSEPKLGQFDDVDATGRANAFVSFLDAQRDRSVAQRAEAMDRLALRPGDGVLDAGCGPGTDTFEIEARVQPRRRRRHGRGVAGARMVAVDHPPG